MALTPTTQIELGFKAPQFLLPDTVTGNLLGFDDIKGEKGTLVMFICNHCPYVVHVIKELVSVAKTYQAKGFGFVAISANDIENYPDDSPEKMTLFAQENNFSFPYLFDETQDVAKAYDAACTPDFSLFDENENCVYRGRLDASTPGNKMPNDGKDLRFALDCLLKGEKIPEPQYPSMGCNIKWKK
jgi:peroxiredoxin